MSNNLVGIQYTANFNNLDGLSVIDADEIFINGQPVDLDNLLPYTGATKEVDLNSQNIKTTHVAIAGPDLINLTTLQNAIQYVEEGASLTFLNKTTTTAQTVASDTDWGTHKITTTYVPVANADLTNKLYVDGQDALRVAKTGDTMTGNLTMSGASTKITQTYNALATDTTTLVNRQTMDAAIAAGGGVSLSGNNTWTGTNNFDGTVFQAENDSLYTIREDLGMSAGSFTAVSGTITSVGGVYTITGGPNGGTATVVGTTFSYTSVLYRFTINATGSLGGSTLTIQQNGVNLYVSDNFGPSPTYTSFSGYFRPPYGSSYAVNWVFRSPAFGGSVSWNSFSLERVKAKVNAGLGQMTIETAPSVATDVANKAYVDTAVSGAGTSLLASTNIWTGTSNKFNNDLLGGKDFYIGANSSGWNSTFTKGIYMRYSTNSGQDGAYIQSVDRSGPTGKPLSFYASSYVLDGGDVATAGLLTANNIIKIGNDGSNYDAIQFLRSTGGYYPNIRCDTNRIAMYCSGAGGWVTGSQVGDMIFYTVAGKSFRFTGNTGASSQLVINSSNIEVNTDINSVSNIKTSAGVIVAGGDPKGSSKLEPGDSSHSGYVSFYYTDAIRAGYMGYADSTNLYLSVENGRKLSIFAPAGIYTNGNFIADCFTKQIYRNAVAWGGGIRLYNAFFRNHGNSNVNIWGYVTGYCGSASTLSLGIQIYSNATGASYYIGPSYFTNVIYNHVAYPFSCQFNAANSTTTGWFDIIIYNAGNFITDTNDYVCVNTTISPTTNY